MFIAQLFGANLYGHLFFFINALAFVLLGVGFSLDSGLAFFTAKNQLNSSGAVTLAFFWAIIAALIAMLFFAMFKQQINITAGNNYLVYCFMYIAGMLLLTFFTALFSAKHHYIVPNITVTIINGILCVLVFVLKTNFEKFTFYFFTAVLVQGFVIGICYLIMFSKLFKLTFLSRAEFMPILKYSAMAFAGNIIFFLVYRVDYWFVNYFIADKGQLGNYIQVSKVGQMFLIVPGIIATTVFSVTAEGKKEAMPQKVVQLSKIIFVMVLLLCIPLIIGGKWLFPFLFGPSFTDMYKPLLFLVPGVVTLACLFPYTAYYSGINKMHINIYGAFVALIIIVLFNLILIPLFGINGSAMASSIGYITYYIYFMFTFKKQNVNLKSALPLLKKEDFNFIKTMFK
ncbi:MAG: polysaccharide biosynthesis C-terminal domain-containing protein [Chitinophagaceae bacterium]|nr:polysaccharide biosynthesis C-terminal domain-containing protein [Chitinophagaceae bacterium]